MWSKNWVIYVPRYNKRKEETGHCYSHSLRRLETKINPASCISMRMTFSVYLLITSICAFKISVNVILVSQNNNVVQRPGGQLNVLSIVQIISKPSHLR